MTDAVKVALIAATPPTIVALIGLVQLRSLTVHLNSRMSELLRINRSDAKSEGQLQERDLQTAREAETKK